jgi:adenine deaminase
VADSQRSVILNQVENGVACAWRCWNGYWHEDVAPHQGGRVIDPASQFDARGRCLIRDGLIAVGRASSIRPGRRVFDATGLIVAPGFIDMHVHLREPGIRARRDHRTGARAAAAGGFTSICCMPNTLPVNDSATVTSYIVERARKWRWSTCSPSAPSPRAARARNWPPSAPCAPRAWWPFPTTAGR